MTLSETILAFILFLLFGVLGTFLSMYTPIDF
jgi:hypothetical protein